MSLWMKGYHLKVLKHIENEKHLLVGFDRIMLCILLTTQIIGFGPVSTFRGKERAGSNSGKFLITSFYMSNFLTITPTICQIKSLSLHFYSFQKVPFLSFTKQINLCCTGLIANIACQVKLFSHCFSEA